MKPDYTAPLAMIAIALTFGASLVAANAAIEPAQIITARQDSLKTLGKTFKALKEELAKPTPDQAAIVTETQTILTLTKALPSWFPSGSGPEAGVKTAAKPEIWSKPAQFAEVASAISVQSGKLAELAAKGDTAATLAQFKETGAACGACHKEFRLKDD